MDIDRHAIASSLALGCFLAVVTIVPNLAAERWAGGAPVGPQHGPVTEASVDAVSRRLRVPAATAFGASSLHASLARAEATALAEFDGEALLRARTALLDGRRREAETLARAVVQQSERERDALQARLRQARGEAASESEQPTQNTQVDDVAGELREAVETAARGRLLLANTLLQDGQASEALKVLEPVADTPIDDFVAWMRAEATEAAGRPAEAAERFAGVAAMDTPLKHRATVRRAHALFDAEDWPKAEAALRGVIADYPEYPRRHRAMFQLGQAYRAQGELQKAADAFHAMWFEFPYKEEGAKARAILAELEAKAIIPSSLPSARERFDRFRRLRINKHWDVARELFTELKEDYATEDGHSAFEHEVEFQLALNAYYSRAFDEARQRLEALAAAQAEGHTAGVSRYLTYKYLSRSLDGLGDRAGALAALDVMGEGYGARTRMRNRAEFYEDHGMYREALHAYDKLYSSGYKRGWHYTWLLYKAGELDQAYENLTRLAERSGGQRRAKYLYWAGRALERAAQYDEAAEVFAEVRDTYELSYYGLQAANRLMDIDQRRSVAGQLAASAEGIANSADRVLDAMDEAEVAMAEAAPRPSPDPRTTLRVMRWEDGGPAALLTGVDPLGLCTADSDDTFCRFPDAPAVAATMALGHGMSASGLTAAVATGAPLGMPLRDPGAEDADIVAPDDSDRDDIRELDGLRDGREARLPVKRAKLSDARDVPRAPYSTAARIYWDGRVGSTVSFARAREGEVIGPMPSKVLAYDEEGYVGGLQRAADEAGELFPELERAHWLWAIGLEGPARWSARDVAIEFRELSRRWRPSRSPHALDNLAWSYYIDNRRSGRDGFWGVDSDELRFPVPSDAAERRALLERQQAIYDMRAHLEPLLVDAFKEAGEHFMVRKYTLGRGGWYRQDPAGPARELWMQAYPRAFPRLVIEHARKNGVNPYLLWALMTVESSYNPDSLSYADALGLLQVIPRTGLKTAIMLGDENFGPQDLLEADVAIEHGAFYFSNLVKKFHGQELFAIAGYNGGPHRVGDWLDMRGRDIPMDEFVEEIPFDQARGYTKKVLRFLALYLKIYEGRDELYVGQNVRPEYRAHPKF